MLSFIRNAMARQSANRVCGLVQHQVKQLISQGEIPVLTHSGVSVAVGIDQIDGTVWGLRPTDAVDVNRGRAIRNEWRNDPRVVSLVVHEMQ